MSIRTPYILMIFAVVVSAYSASGHVSDSASGPETYTLYSAPGGPVTLVVGDSKSTYRSERPILTFNDDTGLPVRVFADHPVTLEIARAELAKCRDAKARAEQTRHRLQHNDAG